MEVHVPGAGTLRFSLINGAGQAHRPFPALDE